MAKQPVWRASWNRQTHVNQRSSELIPSVRWKERALRARIFNARVSLAFVASEPYHSAGACSDYGRISSFMDGYTEGDDTERYVWMGIVWTYPDYTHWIASTKQHAPSVTLPSLPPGNLFLKVCFRLAPLSVTSEVICWRWGHLAWAAQWP
jgi:hypothetical protein